MGNYIITASGGKFHYNEPIDLDEINTFDIAWALSQTNRFNGHTNKPYTVLQHTLAMDELSQRFDGFISPKQRLQLLLHDASEAYLNDIARPVKYMLPDYLKMEKIIQDAIFTKYGLDTNLSESVHAIDTEICAFEGHLFVPSNVHTWSFLKGPYTDDMLRIIEDVQSWDQMKCINEFTQRLVEVALYEW